MKSLWDKKEAELFLHDPLAMRVYSSRVLGQHEDLVLHGGGNTSVKMMIKDVLKEDHHVLMIKGSGWDLATITTQGFAPVRMHDLMKMAQLPHLSDEDMVKAMRIAMLDPQAPNPSVEAILHAIIPFRYVDHSHADALVSLTNTPQGEKFVKEVYGDEVLIIPYVMPGFLLAKYIWEVSKKINWSNYRGMVLLNHGLFTFDDDAKKSYEEHVRLVHLAENFIKRKKIIFQVAKAIDWDLLNLAQIRQDVSRLRGQACVLAMDQSEGAVGFSNWKKLKPVIRRGTVTPDHVIRLKPNPIIIEKNGKNEIRDFAQSYQDYVKKHAQAHHRILDLAPRWAVCPKHGLLSFGANVNEAKVIMDIAQHTVMAMQISEGLGGYKPINLTDLFDMEYWSLEQAKLSSSKKRSFLSGKIALVTGAASGIGRACVDALLQEGVAVAACDKNPQVKTQFNHPAILPLCFDITDDKALKKAIQKVVKHFGGIDILVLNAGIFPQSQSIENIDSLTWDKCLQINLTSQQRLLTEAVPFLKKGLDPTVIFIGSKNVPAPGPGVSAYSVSKAGLTQLARVAALELGQFGVRVHTIHPNQIFDTGIWTEDVLLKRAKHYGVSVEQYKKQNILGVILESKDVAALVLALLSPAFLKTTGSQLAIDGGNDRVI